MWSVISLVLLYNVGSHLWYCTMWHQIWCYVDRLIDAVLICWQWQSNGWHWCSHAVQGVADQQEIGISQMGPKWNFTCWISIYCLGIGKVGFVIDKLSWHHCCLTSFLSASDVSLVKYVKLTTKTNFVGKYYMSSASGLHAIIKLMRNIALIILVAILLSSY